MTHEGLTAENKPCLNTFKCDTSSPQPHYQIGLSDAVKVTSWMVESRLQPNGPSAQIEGTTNAATVFAYKNTWSHVSWWHNLLQLNRRSLNEAQRLVTWSHLSKSHEGQGPEHSFGYCTERPIALLFSRSETWDATTTFDTLVSRLPTVALCTRCWKAKYPWTCTTKNVHVYDPRTSSAPWRHGHSKPSGCTSNIWSLKSISSHSNVCMTELACVTAEYLRVH